MVPKRKFPQQSHCECDFNYDRLYKIRPLLQFVHGAYLKFSPQQRQSIDEQILPFKGKTSLQRYLPKKPKNGALRSYLEMEWMACSLLFTQWWHFINCQQFLWLFFWWYDAEVGQWTSKQQKTILSTFTVISLSWNCRRSFQIWEYTASALSRVVVYVVVHYWMKKSP